MTDFVEFIRAGIVGELRLGISKEETTRRLGLPTEWLGFPGTIGSSVSSPHESDAWFYYSGVVGVYFDLNGISSEIYVNPEKILRDQDTFREWPICADARMKDLREFILKAGIEFEEPSVECDNYWIATRTHCFVTSWGSDQTRVLPPLARKIAMIQKFADSREVNRLKRVLS